MTDILRENTFEVTYRDDYFDVETGVPNQPYHRILYNSGRAVQARELTQMQTIIQTELARFGSNIFRDGAKVSNGNLTLNRREFITLTSNIPSGSPNIVGATYTGDNLEFEVLQYIEQTDEEPATLYIKYTNTSRGNPGVGVVRVGANVTLTPTDSNLPTLTSNDTSPSGRGLFASITAGSFFVQGHFVYTPNQSIIVSKYSATPNVEIGFNLYQEIVTAQDDETLYDNQNPAAPNRSAPGADRLRIRLELTSREPSDNNENFVFLANLIDGRQGEQVTSDNSLNVLYDTLALRTREESGDYIVSNFDIRVDEVQGDDENLEIELEDGIAYVDGYRVEIPFERIDLPKAQTTLLTEGETIVAEYGNYVIFANDSGLPRIHEELDLHSTIALGGGSRIGSAKIRAYESLTTGNRAYLYDIRMNPGQNFSSVRSIGRGVGSGANSGREFIDINEDENLRATSNNTLLFSLPSTRPSTIAYNSSNDITVQAVYEVPTDASGNSRTDTVVLNADSFTDTSSWIIVRRNHTRAADEPLQPAGSNIRLTTNNTRFSISGLEANQTYDVYVYEIRSGSSNGRGGQFRPIIKRLITTNGGSDASSERPVYLRDMASLDGTSSNRFISLRVADVYRINSITYANDPTNTDVKDNFIFDNGQRDNFYGLGRLILRNDLTYPTSGNIQINFSYFSSGNSSGSHYDLSSYSLDYDQIPSYRRSDGVTVNLRDVLDFRPTATYTSTSNGIPQYNFSTLNQPLLPRNNSTFDINVTYYLPRNDRVVARTLRDNIRLPRGEINLIQGAPSLQPVLPPIPEGSLPLYNVYLNPFTFNEEDLRVEQVPSRRYTMQDISVLEDRIDTLTEFTALSLLENATESLTVLDEMGLERTKVGFIADNFADTTFSDITNNEYRASISETDGILTTEVYAGSVDLLYNSTSNTQLTGNIVTLPYTHVSFINQNLATETENVNPFNVILALGDINLSPSSDNFTIVDGGTRTVTSTVFGWRNWASTWFSTVRRVIGTNVLRTRNAEFMRSRLVYFRVTGLRPNTRYYPYLNNRAIDNYTREEPFIMFSSREDGVNIASGRTSHPRMSNNLISDENGNLTGSFIVPNNNAIRIPVGRREFKLLDVSGGNDNNATSLARTLYTSEGTIETRQNTVRSTRIQNVTNVIVPPPREGGGPDNDGGGRGGGGGPDGGGADPLAQTFLVNPTTNPNGIFLTRVRLYFSTKDDNNVPVEVQIRAVENGIPVSAPITGATKSLNPNEVNTVPRNPNIQQVRANGTDFTFDEPIYLSPGREYAIVVIANSDNYNVYVARTSDFVVGSNSQRISKQPTLGSLFLSQNSFTWTPDQERDLMFEIYRAEFDTTQTRTAVLSNEQSNVNASSLRQAIPITDPFQFTQNDLTVRVHHPGHGFSRNDRVRFIIPTGAIDSVTTGINENYFNNNVFIITSVDYTGYTFELTGNGVSVDRSERVGGRGNIVVVKNFMYDVICPSVQTLLPANVTSISATASKVSGASYAGNRNSSTGPRYSKESPVQIQLNEFNFESSPHIILSNENETFHGITGRSFDLNITLTSTDSRISPIIDLERASLTTFENIIDRQDATATNGFNVPISYVAETDNSNGSSAAKHITRTVILDEPAVGINVLLTANRPSDAEIEVYYRTNSGDEENNLENINWISVSESTNNPADNNRETFRQYEYLAGGLSGNLDEFTKFQIKVVMNTRNSSQVPTIRDLRAIALAS